jgi:hypothetical protein
MTSRVTFAGGKNSNYCFKWQRGNLLYKLVSSTNLGSGNRSTSLSNVRRLAAHPKFVWNFNANCDGTIIYNVPVVKKDNKTSYPRPEHSLGTKIKSAPTARGLVLSKTYFFLDSDVQKDFSRRIHHFYVTVCAAVHQSLQICCKFFCLRRNCQ